MIDTRITGNGRVTLPKQVRTALGVQAGDILLWEIVDGAAVLTRVAGNGDRIDALADSAIDDH